MVLADTMTWAESAGSELYPSREEPALFPDSSGHCCRHVGIALCSKQYFAGRVPTAPVVGSTQGHAPEPKNGGLVDR